MRYIKLLILTLISLSLQAQRSESIEIELDLSKVSQSLLDSNILDIEYSSKEGYYILWIHPDSTYKPFKQEHFIYLNAAKSAYNRKTKTDHLNIFIETQDEIDNYGEIDIDSKKFKNIKFSELKNVDLTKVKFKRNLNK